MAHFLSKKLNLARLRPVIRHQFLCPTCIHCGHFAVQESLFCKSCETNFLASQTQDLIKRCLDIEDQIKVFSCFYWINDERHLNQKLVYMLKQSYSEMAWGFYAQQICKKYFDDEVSENFLFENCIFIPVPSVKSKGHHTRFLTQKLSRLLRVKSIDLLKKAEISTEQKRLNLQMRSHIKIGIDPKNISHLSPKITKVILIDDIITTGSTIQACATALRTVLSPHTAIEAWCLFDRPRSFDKLSGYSEVIK